MSFRFREEIMQQLQSFSGDYSVAKILSQRIDLELGFQIEGTEQRIQELTAQDQCSSFETPQGDRQLWHHLSSDIFQTPYSELYRILCELGPGSGSRVIDLGAGYGRMAFVLEAFFESVEFVGYEISAERVQEARRVFEKSNLERSKMMEADLQVVGFQPAEAEFYFIYDFGTRSAIEKVLEDLRLVAATRSIQVAARGRASRDAIERGHPWLSQVIPPRHFPHFSIYSS